MTSPQALETGARAILGRPLEETERGKFAKYLELLTEWNRVHRLVGSSDPVWIVENLFLDSLLFLRVLPPDFGSILDLGSGAGLPGVPITIVRPGARLTMIESRRRRASFLSTVVRELPLEGAVVVNERVEAVANELSRRFDVVVMRCAGGLSGLLPVAAGLVVTGGVVAASGPPRPTPLPIGEWVTVEGASPGRTRRFAVYRSPRSPV